MKEEHVIHPLDPIIDQGCEILILGSLPSVKSREVSFYYGHPQNRFWKIISALTHTPLPKTNEEKREMLLSNHIALWDTIQSCIITGSSDSSIREVEVNDIAGLIESTHISRIYCNGNTSYKYYHRYIEKQTGIKAETLPSSSPANASYSLERLIEVWGRLLTRS